MAVEEGEAGIVGEEIDFGFLVAAEHEDIFHYACCRDTGDFGEFKSVAMQMDRMDVVALVAQADAIAAALR